MITDTNDVATRLAIDLMTLLRDYGVTPQSIQKFTTQEIKEIDVQKDCGSAIGRVQGGQVAFASEIRSILMNFGATWNTNHFNVKGMAGISEVSKHPIREDMAAIVTFAASGRLDACKAITNVFRVIKVLITAR